MGEGRTRADRQPPVSPLFLALGAAILVCVAVLVLGANWQAWFGPEQKTPADAALRGPAKVGAKADPFAAYTAGKAGDPAAATKLVEAFAQAARADNNAYIDELAAAGYLRALGGEALTAGEVGQAGERVRKGREISARYAARSATRIDALAASLAALPAGSAEAAALKEEMTAEVEALREARRDYWDAQGAIGEEMQALATILNRTQGRWTPNLATRQIEFQEEADDREYSLHEDRNRAHRRDFDAAGARVDRAAAALKTMAARWGS